MTTPPKRKLIEVAMPLDAINKASRADKNRKTGTIRNLHKWFAPMPTPAWRALISAALIDDPGNPQDRQALLGKIAASMPGDGSLPSDLAMQDLQDALKANFASVESTVVYDPFAGGGSTLIEAQRLGMDTLGTDVNPVPTLITRFLTEIVPSLKCDAPLLAGPSQITSDPISSFIHDAETLAHEIRDEALGKLAVHYPNVDGMTPIAWLWCHAFPCQNPACGRQIPLHASNKISLQRGRAAWLAHEITGTSIEFRIVEREELASPPTKAIGRRAEFLCPACGSGVNDDDIKRQSASLSVRPMALVCQDNAVRRHFGSVEYRESFMERLAGPDLDLIDLPAGGLGLRVQPYGFRYYEDLFLPRQQIMLATFADVVSAKVDALRGLYGSDPRVLALGTFMGLCVGKLAHVSSKQATWRTRQGPSKAEAAFGQSILPMVWDFAETNPFGGSVGDWQQIVQTALRALRPLPRTGARGRVFIGDARSVETSVVTEGNPVLVAADPPYFDAIGYADLSDYFYIWHRRALRRLWPDLYATLSVPRAEELVADSSRHKGNASAATSFFIDGFTATFRRLSALSNSDLPMLVVYAHQQKERGYGKYGSTGWEAMLQALVNAGLTITASWPIHCTSETRLRGQGSNALASYVVLACRPREAHFGSTTRRALLASLKAELPEALRNLQQGSVAPVDLAQAAIGPGMAIFTRYREVIEPDGSRMTIGTALAEINRVLDELLSEQEGDFDADTRFCVKWFSQFGFNEADSGTADTLSRATNTSVSGLVRGGMFRARAGKARLLDFDELSADWDPASDERVSVWEVVVRLAKALDERGGEEAARLMALAGQKVDLDTAKELAYLLFSICEKKGWTQTALLFNGLGTSWSDLSAASRSSAVRVASQVQAAFEFDDEGE
ncbi:DUF1156 domain-containing protein [Streptomyces fradiae]|uniref:DUF1156 domain-containing protein n=1 Tax=Streptomyces fradiae TaxID=1906 RepID=UPI003407FD60